MRGHARARGCALFAMLLVTAVATARDAEPRQFLDERTAVTITVQREPLVFARDVPEFAANARDYYNVGVVEFNRMGRYRYYLCIVGWSTVDRSVLPVDRPTDPLAHVVLHLDKGALTLDRATAEGRSIGISHRVFEPAARGPRTVAWYELDPEQLQRLAASESLWLEVAGDTDLERRFELWTDRRDALRAFAEQAVKR